jgi:hypothetical protein
VLGLDRLSRVFSVYPLLWPVLGRKVRLSNGIGREFHFFCTQNPRNDTDADFSGVHVHRALVPSVCLVKSRLDIAEALASARGKAMEMNTSLPRLRLAGQCRARFLDRPVRNLTTAVASFAVVAVVVLFLAGPAGSPAVSFRLTSYAISARDVVIYGTVFTSADHAVTGAEVQICRIVKGRSDTIGQLRTNSSGLYRLAVQHLSKTALQEKVTIYFDRRRYSGEVRFIARPGHAYGVRACLAGRGSLFFLPISSY